LTSTTTPPVPDNIMMMTEADKDNSDDHQIIHASINSKPSK
jgi:hypothetical protein